MTLQNNTTEINSTLDLTEQEVHAMDNIEAIVYAIRRSLESHNCDCVVNPATGEVIDINDLNTVYRTLDFLLFWDGKTYNFN